MSWTDGEGVTHEFLCWGRPDELFEYVRTSCNRLLIVTSSEPSVYEARQTWTAPIDCMRCLTRTR